MLAFAGGVAATMIGFLVEHGEAMLGNDPGETVGALLIGGIALVTAGATWLHWRRFMVPITVAAGTAALAATAVALILSLTGVPRDSRSEEHTSELQSLMRISYAVFCLQKQKLK